MESHDTTSSNRIRKNPEFTPTNWSVIGMAQNGSDSKAFEALNHICARYWYPLYVFVRRKDCSPDQAEEMTQAFFAHILEKDFLDGVKPEKGRFRSFLITCLKNFMATEWRKEKAIKRIPTDRTIPIDAQTAEERYKLEPKDPNDDPRRHAERLWARELLNHVLEQLEDEQIADGKGELFRKLLPLFLRDGEGITSAAIGASLGMSPDAVRNAVLRLRQRYRALLRNEISKTVTNPDEIDGEIRYLFSVLGGST